MNADERRQLLIQIEKLLELPDCRVDMHRDVTVLPMEQPTFEAWETSQELTITIKATTPKAQA